MHFQNAITVFLSRVVQEELEEQQLWYELDKQTNCKPTTLGKKLRNQHAQSTYKSTEKHIYLPDAPVFFGFMAYIRNMNKQQGILLWRQQGAAFQVYRTFFLSVHSYSSYVLFHVIEILVETHTGVNIRPWSESWVNSLREVNYCQLLSRTSCFVCSGLGSCSPGWFCNSCSWRDVTTPRRILWVLEHSHCVFVAKCEWVSRAWPLGCLCRSIGTIQTRQTPCNWLELNCTSTNPVLLSNVCMLELLNSRKESINVWLQWPALKPFDTLRDTSSSKCCEYEVLVSYTETTWIAFHLRHSPFKTI